MKSLFPLAKAVPTVAFVLLAIAFFLGVVRLGGVEAKANTPKAGAARNASVRRDSQLLEAYGKLPFAFEENIGQSDSQVRFLSRGKGYELFLTPAAAVLELRHSAANSSAILHTVKPEQSASMLGVVFEGASGNVQIDGVDQLPGRTDYFVGNNPKNWHTNLSSYSRVQYRGIYPGVDLIFYGKQQKLEYDFVVAPHGDPTKIALAIQGGGKLRLDKEGNLLVAVTDGELQLDKPIVYQEVKGDRREIAGKYVVAGDRVRFDISAYDQSKALIIDPVLNYSTYLGGSVIGDDGGGMGIAIDSLGDAYVAGQTFSTTFPMSSTISGFNPGPPGGSTSTQGAVFVTELNPTGSQEVYSTYLSGDGGEAAFALALDATGNIYVTGQTFSTDFPTTLNALNAGPLSGASAALGHAFISKINPKVSGMPSLVYSSYLAGDGMDAGNAIAADALGNAYIGGGTTSGTGFPTQGGYSTSLPSSNGNAFLTRIDTTQTTGPASLIYSTYLGGTSGTITFGLTDQVFGVAVDSSQNAYLVGSTAAPDFPTTSNAYLQNSQAPSGVGNGTVFVSKVNTNLTGSSSLAYSTYLAGPVVGANGDFGAAIALGPNNVAYVVGSTGSSQFPVFPAAMVGTTPGTFPSPPGALTAVAFVSKINTLLSGSSSLLYSTLLGGSNGDQAAGVAVDSLGNAYVDGITASVDFPLTAGAYQMTLPNSQGDGFITKLSTAGTGASDLLYSTYFGGSGNGSVPDRIFAIAADSINDVYVVGRTASSGLATSGALQTSLPAGSTGAFIAKFSLIPTVSISPLTIAFGNQSIHTTSASQALTLANNTGAAATIVIPPTITGPNTADFSVTAVGSGGNPACTASLAGASSCTFGVAFTPSTSGAAESATLTVTYTAGVSGNGPISQTISLTGTGTNASPVANVTPSSISFGGQLVTIASTAQAITVKNTGTANLNITAAPSVTGSNSSEFSVATNSTCTSGTAVTPNSSCVINVAFTPAAGASGSRSATLNILDNATGSPQAITLSGTAWDFGLSAQAVTISPGQTGTIAVSVTGIGGFTGAVTLSCTGGLSCTAPAPVTAPGTGNLTVAAKGLIVTLPTVKTPPISLRQMALLAVGLILILTLPASRRLRTRLGLVGAAAVLIVIAGCSSTPGTPAGTYPMTITGTSGGLSHTITATVTVS